MTLEIEQAFAAAVLNARGYARIANTAGIYQSVSDQVWCAIDNLKEQWPVGGDNAAVREVVERYVYFDADGQPQPCRTEPNVVPLRR